MLIRDLEALLLGARRSATRRHRQARAGLSDLTTWADEWRFEFERCGPANWAAFAAPWSAPTAAPARSSGARGQRHRRKRPPASALEPSLRDWRRPTEAPRPRAPLPCWAWVACVASRRRSRPRVRAGGGRCLALRGTTSEQQSGVLISHSRRARETAPSQMRRGRRGIGAATSSPARRSLVHEVLHRLPR